MTILFGHPGGNPFSYHAALAHFLAGRLEAFCVPWMPSERTIDALRAAPLLRPMARRLGRRQFPPLASAPKVQGRVGEWRRLLIRALGRGDEGLSYEANDWLMHTMRRECRRTTVTAVHAYEDCSLWQFREAKRLGKACIYDMPIGYYPAWEQTQAQLARRYVDWLPPGGLPSRRHVRPEQKREEMNLADLVLVPSRFVEKTIATFHPHKAVARAAYGVDLEFWKPSGEKREAGPLRFLYAGQLSVRKGIPLLLNAWQAAGLRDAELELVGTWQLATSKRAELPAGVRWLPPCSSEELRERYRKSDVFVLPSFFEGKALVLGEALSCGMPVIATEASGADNLIEEQCGRLIPTGSLDALVTMLRLFNDCREALSAMRQAARSQAERCTWEGYRSAVTDAVAPFV